MYQYRTHRKHFIISKYVDRKYVVPRIMRSPVAKLKNLENAVKEKDIFILLQAYAEKMDLSEPVLESSQVRLLPVKRCGIYGHFSRDGTLIPKCGTCNILFLLKSIRKNWFLYYVLGKIIYLKWFSNNVLVFFFMAIACSVRKLINFPFLYLSQNLLNVSGKQLDTIWHRVFYISIFYYLVSSRCVGLLFLLSVVLIDSNFLFIWRPPWRIMLTYFFPPLSLLASHFVSALHFPLNVINKINK